MAYLNVDGDIEYFKKIISGEYHLDWSADVR